MITYQIFKDAVTRYQHKLSDITANKTYFYNFYEFFIAEEQEVPENNLFSEQLKKLSEGIHRRHKNPHGKLNDNELFVLFNLMVHYKSYADGKLLMKAFDETLSNELDYKISTMVKIVKTCHEAHLFDLSNLKNLLSIFDKRQNRLSLFDHMLVNFKKTPLNLNQHNLDIMMQLGHERGMIGNHIHFLNESGLFNDLQGQINFDTLAANASKLDEYCMYFLSSCKLLTQENYNKLLAYSYPPFVTFLFTRGGEELLTQDNLDLFFANETLGSAAEEWMHEPKERIDQAMLLKMIATRRTIAVVAVLEDQSSNSDAVDSDDSYSGRHSPRLFAQANEEFSSSSTEEEVVDLTRVIPGKQ